MGPGSFMLQGAQESGGGGAGLQPRSACPFGLSLINIPSSSEGRGPGTAHKASLCLILEGRGDVCVHQEDRGRGIQASRPRSHPPPKPAFQRKSHLRPRWWAQQVRRSPAGLAPGPCHMEQGGVSRMARPRLPLTPPEYTHRSPRVSPTLLCTHRNPLGAEPAPVTPSAPYSPGSWPRRPEPDTPSPLSQCHVSAQLAYTRLLPLLLQFYF